MLSRGHVECLRNGGAVHLSRYIKTKATHKCVAIIEGLNSSVIQWNCLKEW